jgi:hypothetical protein
MRQRQLATQLRLVADNSLSPAMQWLARNSAAINTAYDDMRTEQAIAQFRAEMASIREGADGRDVQGDVA